MIDLVPGVVESSSRRVKVQPHHVSALVDAIREHEPRFACVIHSKVRNALNRHGGLVAPLEFGLCGQVLPGCPTAFLFNYFPNGNHIADSRKIEVFKTLRDALE